LLLVLVLSSVMPVNAQNKYQMMQDEYGTYYVEIDGLKYYAKGPNDSRAYLRDDLNPGITGSIKIVDNFIGIYGLKEKLHNVNSVDLHGTGISSVTLPNKQYTSLKFNDCMNLRSVTFVSSAYESMTSMGNCFYGCTSLTNVYFLPSSLTGLGDSTFEGCTGLETVSLPEGVTSIGKNCFAGCTNLHTIALGNNIARIGENAFENCISLQSVIIPKGLEVLSVNTFNGCTNLYNLYFEEDSKLNLINNGAFGGCDNLKKIVLPDREPGVKLDGNVFDSGLEEIVISKNSIVISGFQKCSNLKDVYVLWDKKEYRMNIPDNYFWLDGNSETTLFGTTTLHVPTGTTAFYKELTKYAWSKFEHIVEFDTTDVHYIVDVNLNTGGTVFFNSQNRYVRKGKATFEKDGKAYTDFWFKIVPDKGYKIKSVTNNYVNEKTNTEVISRISADGYYEVKYTGWRQKLNVVFTRDYSYKPKGNSISFNSQSVQNVCIDNWDSDDDGVFSPDEAASVTSLDGKFQAVSASRTRAEQDLITSFDELIYFTGLTSLADDEFNGQTEMTSVTIPVNVKSIGKSAFHDCSSLISMIIPANVTSIGENAFIGCTGLTEITVESDTPVDISGNARFDEAIYANAVLYVPVGSKEKYLAAEGWKNFASILEDGINESVQGGQISFADPVVETICLKSWDANKDEKLSEAEAAAVTSLGEVFRNSEITTFDELQYFTGLTKLDNNAFTNCKLLTALTIPANVTTIGESVFAGCEKLTGLKVAEGNASFNMDDGVLYNKNYTSLIFCPVAKTGTVTVNSTTTTIRENAFYNCTQLTGISLSSSLTTISSAAFVGCSSLTTIAIPANVSSIGMGCFTGCTALKSITVDTGNSAYSASDGVLVENQTKLMAYPNAKGDTYAVGEGVTTIDGYAFCMTGIKSLTLPSTLKTISDYAISYCSNLTTITSYATVPPIVSATAFSEGTFSGAMLNVPIGCKESYSTTDVWKNFSNIVEIGKDGPEFITIGKSGKASYCGDKSLDFSFSDEIKAYIATGFDKDEGTIWLTRVKDVPAGVPVLIKGEANKTYDVPVTNSQNSYYTNMFVGNTTGEKMVIQETDGDMVNYYLSGDGTFKSVNKTANIGTNKCYLQLPGTFEAAATGAAQTVKIGSIGKASFAAPVDLDFTNVSGLKAFTATGYDKSTKTIWLTRVMKVQKGEGVLLKGDPNSYEIPSAAVQSRYENMFIGNTSGNEIQVLETSEDGSQTNYYLSGKDGSFVSVSGYAKIGDNKCYLALPTSMVAVSSTRSAEDDYKFEEPEVIKLPIDFKSIGSEGDGTTGVKEVKSGEAKGDEWYTLQGQRVAKPGKGVYIHNGHKVVIRSTTK